MALSVELFATPAAAHLALVTPPSRYGGTILKDGPCGLAGGSRGSTVLDLEAGSTLAITWDEYIDHPGHYRVAFDDDGDDDFADPPCTAGCSTRSPTITLYSDPTVLLDGIPDRVGGRTTIEVGLPDIECDRCTVQVIQVMYDKPPYEIGGNDLYYQCIDVRLRRTQPKPTATPSASPSPTSAPPSPTLTPSPSATPTSSATPSPTPTSTPACAGDCDLDGRVDVADLLRMTAVALGDLGLQDCPSGDARSDGAIDVTDLVAAIQHALNGCRASNDAR